MKQTIDRGVAFGAAISGSVLTILVHQQVVGAGTAADVASLITVAVGAYHGGAAVQRRDVPNVAPSPTQTPIAR